MPARARRGRPAPVTRLDGVPVVGVNDLATAARRLRAPGAPTCASSVLHAGRPPPHVHRRQPVRASWTTARCGSRATGDERAQASSWCRWNWRAMLPEDDWPRLAYDADARQLPRRAPQRVRGLTAVRGGLGHHHARDPRRTRSRRRPWLAAAGPASACASPARSRACCPTRCTTRRSFATSPSRPPAVASRSSWRWTLRRAAIGSRPRGGSRHGVARPRGGAAAYEPFASEARTGTARAAHRRAGSRPWR